MDQSPEYLSFPSRRWSGPDAMGLSSWPRAACQTASPEPGRLWWTEPILPEIGSPLRQLTGELQGRRRGDSELRRRLRGCGSMSGRQPAPLAESDGGSLKEAELVVRLRSQPSQLIARFSCFYSLKSAFAVALATKGASLRKPGPKIY